MTASTGTTAQAVVFIAQATPSARPALTSLPRPAQARTRQVSAMIGGSVTPTASGNAMSGEATATAVHQATRLRQSRQLSSGGTTPRTPRGAPDGSAIVSGAR